MKTEQFVKRVLYLILNWESDWSFPHVDQFLSNRPAELGIFVYELGEMCLFLKKNTSLSHPLVNGEVHLKSGTWTLCLSGTRFIFLG